MEHHSNHSVYTHLINQIKNMYYIIILLYFLNQTRRNI